MANLFDYLDWRGDLPFSAAPFCEVDNLILSLLSYPDYSTLLLEQDRVGLPLEKLVPLYFTHRPRGAGGLGLLLGERILDLLERAAASPRFANVRVWGHRSRLDKGRGLQFSATTFSLGGGESFVAFRGTDDTLTGWKEDFNMTVSFPIPAQEEAAAYLSFVADSTADRLLIGGHSKGGNLAVYAAATCDAGVQERIVSVWSNDGPGFSREFLDSPGYRAIRDRVYPLMPRSSVVGILFEWDPAPELLESNASGAFQHEGLTWMVLGSAFVRAPEQSRGSRQLDRSLRTLLQEMDLPCRRQIIDDMFSVGEELGVETLAELMAEGRRRQSFRALSSKLTGIDRDTRDCFLRAVKAVLREDDVPYGEG